MKNVIKLLPVVVLILFWSFKANKKIIVIDAGHGGKDKGAVYQDYMEKDIVLAIASKIKKLNPSEDVEIILSRDCDSYPSLQDRANAINKLNPDLVVSLHVNNSPEKNSEKEGLEIYVSEKNPKAIESKKLADDFSKFFGNAVVKYKDLFILKNTNAPAMIVELGYLNNKKDREYITSESGQKEIAEKILGFLTNQ